MPKLIKPGKQTTPPAEIQLYGLFQQQLKKVEQDPDESRFLFNLLNEFAPRSGKAFTLEDPELPGKSTIPTNGKLSLSILFNYISVKKVCDMNLDVLAKCINRRTGEFNQHISFWLGLLDIPEQESRKKILDELDEAKRKTLFKKHLDTSTDENIKWSWLFYYADSAGDTEDFIQNTLNPSTLSVRRLVGSLDYICEKGKNENILKIMLAELEKRFKGKGKDEDSLTSQANKANIDICTCLINWIESIVFNQNYDHSEFVCSTIKDRLIPYYTELTNNLTHEHLYDHLKSGAAPSIVTLVSTAGLSSRRLVGLYQSFFNILKNSIQALTPEELEKVMTDNLPEVMTGNLLDIMCNYLTSLISSQFTPSGKNNAARIEQFTPLFEKCVEGLETRALYNEFTKDLQLICYYDCTSSLLFQTKVTYSNDAFGFAPHRVPKRFRNFILSRTICFLAELAELNYPFSSMAEDMSKQYGDPFSLLTTYQLIYSMSLRSNKLEKSALNAEKLFISSEYQQVLNLLKHPQAASVKKMPKSLSELLSNLNQSVIDGTYFQILNNLITSPRLLAPNLVANTGKSISSISNSSLRLLKASLKTLIMGFAKQGFLNNPLSESQERQTIKLMVAMLDRTHWLGAIIRYQRNYSFFRSSCTQTIHDLITYVVKPLRQIIQSHAELSDEEWAQVETLLNEKTWNEKQVDDLCRYLSKACAPAPKPSAPAGKTEIKADAPPPAYDTITSTSTSTETSAPPAYNTLKPTSTKVTTETPKHLLKQLKGPELKAPTHKIEASEFEVPGLDSLKIDVAEIKKTLTAG